jgi:hypothetical protein
VRTWLSDNPFVDPALFRIRDFTRATLPMAPFSTAFGGFLLSLVCGRKACGASVSPLSRTTPRLRCVEICVGYPYMGGEPIGHLTLNGAAPTRRAGVFFDPGATFRRGQQAQSVRPLPTLIEAYGAGPRTCATEPMPWRQRRRQTTSDPWKRDPGRRNWSASRKSKVSKDGFWDGVDASSP